MASNCKFAKPEVSGVVVDGSDWVRVFRATSAGPTWRLVDLDASVPLEVRIEWGGVGWAQHVDFTLNGFGRIGAIWAQELTVSARRILAEDSSLSVSVADTLLQTPTQAWEDRGGATGGIPKVWAAPAWACACRVDADPDALATFDLLNPLGDVQAQGTSANPAWVPLGSARSARVVSTGRYRLVWSLSL
jgi:hypothetical protein